MTRRVVLAISVGIAGCAGLGAYSVTALVGAAQDAATAAATNGTKHGNRSVPAVDSLVGIFEGRTPCGMIANDFTGFPVQGCEKIKWRLTLSRDPSTGHPTTYQYQGTRSTRQGVWNIERDAGPERRVLYHLEYGPPAKILSLLSVDGNVLLLLDRNLRVLVGDASWSYALNRKP